MAVPVNPVPCRNTTPYVPAWLTGTCRVCANGCHRERACYGRCAVTAAAGYARDARTKGLQPRLQRAPDAAMPQYEHALVLRPEVKRLAAGACGAAKAWHSSYMRHLPCARMMRSRLVTKGAPQGRPAGRLRAARSRQAPASRSSRIRAAGTHGTRAAASSAPG